MKMKTLGFLGGMSYHSSIVYYARINYEVQARMGSPCSAPLLMRSFNYDKIGYHLLTKNWPTVKHAFVTAGQEMKASGAEALAIGSCLGHKVAGDLEKATGLTLLHIADGAAREVKKRGLKRVGLLGTRAVMEEEFIKARLMERAALDKIIVPDKESCEEMDDWVFGDLAAGSKPTEERMLWLDRMMWQMAEKGAQGIVLGCTDMPLAVRRSQHKVPIFDMAYYHAKHMAAWSTDTMSDSEEECVPKARNAFDHFLNDYKRSFRQSRL